MIVAISGQILYCIDIFPRGVLNTVNIFQYSMITPIFTGAPEYTPGLNKLTVKKIYLESLAF